MIIIRANHRIVSHLVEVEILKNPFFHTSHPDPIFVHQRPINEASQVRHCFLRRIDKEIKETKVFPRRSVHIIVSKAMILNRTLSVLQHSHHEVDNILSFHSNSSFIDREQQQQEKNQ
jgi:hypothetical protein